MIGRLLGQAWIDRVDDRRPDEGAKGLMASFAASLAAPAVRAWYGSSTRGADGLLETSQLDHPTLASIRRDEFGVPHIRAATEKDQWFLFGLVHAQDRLWQWAGEGM